VARALPRCVRSGPAGSRKLADRRDVAREQGSKVIARNRRARHDYTIEEVIEAGIALTGTEVKSLRAGRASLTDGFALISDGEVWLHNVHIPEYTQGTWTNHVPRRTRKLLLHRREIERLVRKTSEQGLTLVPLSMYFKDGKVKVELALGRGKRTYDKRQDLARRDAAREVERALRRRR
jgi:SsrA-binding protein